MKLVQLTSDEVALFWASVVPFAASQLFCSGNLSNIVHYSTIVSGVDKKFGVRVQ